MALRLVTEQGDLVEPVVPAHPVALTASEITGLIGLFQTMLDAMEGRLIGRLDLNAKGAADRWERHDAEQARHLDAIGARFVSVEAKVETLATAVKDHHDQQHDEDVRMDARVRPIRTATGWIWANRTNLMIVAIGLIAVGTFVVEAAGRLFGVHP